MIPFPFRGRGKVFPGTSGFAVRFTQTYDYAEAHGFVGGFPNFHQADYGEGIVYGTFLLNSGEWRDVSASDLGNPPGYSIGARFRAISDYAARNGFVGGFPNFHQADYGSGLVYGNILLGSNEAEWRDVPASELGNPSANNYWQRFRATSDYAARNGFAGGFPNFHHADYGRGRVYGTILIKQAATEWRDVPRTVMRMYSWPFDNDYTRAQRLRVLERHTFAYSQIRQCGNLDENEKSDLLRKYTRSIHHSITNDANVNGRATVGGDQIWVNTTVLFPQGNNEIAQTLIHEMMHSAGYTHPGRRACVGRLTPPNCDRPGDNGQYYGTAPLRAEFCIAGIQSDRVCVSCR